MEGIDTVAVLGGGTMGGGIAAGEGFKTYSDDERDRLLLERDRRYAALGRLLEE